MEFEGLSVSGLNLQSVQGDRRILAALAAFGARIARRGGVARATKDRPRAATINVQAIPDLVPPLAALAATSPGTTTLSGAARLRLKESDRLETVSAAINALGGHATISDDKLLIEGTEQLAGGTLDAAGDHRIAMMGAIMATHAREGVVILGAHCVEKSYPTFWDDYAKLGGKVHLI
jgi:3-phosphoshikimate 1-carboxyvinyltransferase